MQWRRKICKMSIDSETRKEEQRVRDESKQSASPFEQQAQAEQPSFLVEFADFLIHNKKWWLTPIIVILLFVGLLVVLGGSGAAPFIYTLF